MALDGRTLAETADVPVSEQDKWLAIIQNARLSADNIKRKPLI
jgi:hypothetical protein